MRFETVVIENITPKLDGGRYPIKRIVGDHVTVEADIFKDGHDLLSAIVKWRKVGDLKWEELPMHVVDNDRWQGYFTLPENAMFEYTVEAWTDRFNSWRHEVQVKYKASQPHLRTEAQEGAALLNAAAKRASRSNDQNALLSYAKKMAKADSADLIKLIDLNDLQSLMSAYPDRSHGTEFHPFLRIYADRKQASFSAWYEFFPRSAEGKASKGSRFRDCVSRIEDAYKMGFDIIYFPPIHPIGTTHRKGPNNSLVCKEGDPGVPYAIGNYKQGIHGGGHKDVAPELGTLEDFDWLVAKIRDYGMEIALDFAINCSPDHPYVKEHPEWFFHRPDGSIKYAENPPKKYEDVYPLNFHNSDWQSLWKEMRSILLFWAERNVRIFRVDNPHTKPVAFWEWIIREVQDRFPDVIFLSEAFTRPKMMKVLAKAGFTQSYTYFTWRNHKQELTDYLTELTQSEMKDYFRGNLFTNTPDILPFYLQKGGRPAFQIRAILAATLSPIYGIYSGFELCENAALPGREEYAESEKYQFKARDWNAKGNIKDLITKLNHIRKENRSLQEYANLQFHFADNDQILFYTKRTTTKDNVLMVITTLDPFYKQSGFVEVPLDVVGIQPNENYQVEDLLTGEHYDWKGAHNFVILDPKSRPAHILKVMRNR